MTQLLIARHGNTFEPDEIPTRVGLRTDLPLSKSGIQQAKALAAYFQKNNITPSIVYTSDLKRTKQTAQYACQNTPMISLSMFNEIDYGPDENQPETEVIARIGIDAIKAWNQHAIVPPGWIVSPEKIIDNWHQFSEFIRKKHAKKIVLVVTSNGIARFAPYLTGDFETFSRQYDIKLKTGALASFTDTGHTWQVNYWNENPKKC